MRYAQEAFATTLAGKLPPGGRIKGDEPQVLMLRFRLTNLPADAATGRDTASPPTRRGQTRNRSMRRTG